MRPDPGLPAPSRAERLALAASVAGLALLHLSLALHPVGNVDLWWQLATGRLVLERGAVPVADPFSWLAAGRPWIELRWGWCVAAWLGWSAGGAPLLVLAATAISGAAFAVVVVPARAALRSPGAVALVATGLVAASDRFVVRPELVTFLLLAVFLTVLARAARGGARFAVWLLPALQIVWVNTHTVFVLGPAVAWMSVAGAAASAALAWRRAGPASRGRPVGLAVARLAGTAALVTAACWVNPYGTDGVLFPFRLLGQIQPDHLLARTIEEFRSPFAIAIGAWPPWLAAAAVLAVAVAASFVLAARVRALDAGRLLAFAAFAWLAGLSLRNVSPFALVATWAGLANLAPWLAARKPGPPRELRVAGHAALAVALVALGWYVATGRAAERFGGAGRAGVGVVAESVPGLAAEAVLRHRPEGRLYHALADGSYLIWAAGETYDVYVDGRLEVYGEELFERYFEGRTRVWEDAEQWTAFADGLGVRTLVLHLDFHARLLELLADAPGWALVHVDGRNTVWLRRIPEHREIVERAGIDPRAPWTAPGPPRDVVPPRWARALGAVARPWESLGLARTFLALGAPANAASALEAGLDRTPDAPELRLLLAQIRRSEGRDAEADALVRGLDLPPAVRARGERLLATLLWRAGRPEEAIAPLERALALEPGSRELWSDLVAVRIAAGRWEDAAAACREALARDRDDARMWVDLGTIHERLDQPGAALEAYRRALAVDPRRPAVWNAVGVLLARSGDRDGAAEAFHRALAVDPRHGPARANLDRLARDGATP
jgi:tetratricopeptide (TPR) repeat protein